MRISTINRAAATLSVATALASATAALPTAAQAAPQLTTSWSHEWANSWTAENSFVSTTGWVDIWTICTPISNRTRKHQIEIKSDSPFYRKLYVACDRRPHWVRKVAVPTGTALWTKTWPDPDLGHGVTSVYGYGYKL